MNRKMIYPSKLSLKRLVLPLRAWRHLLSSLTRSPLVPRLNLGEIRWAVLYDVFGERFCGWMGDDETFDERRPSNVKNGWRIVLGLPPGIKFWLHSCRPGGDRLNPPLTNEGRGPGEYFPMFELFEELINVSLRNIICTTDKGKKIKIEIYTDYNQSKIIEKTY